MGKHTRTPRGHRRREAALDRKSPMTERLRAKAEQRLEDMPEPIKRAIGLGETVVGLMLIPLRFGLHLACDFLEVPAALLRVFSRRET
ncbi:MAG: hypothetical protein E6J78_01480 [Deltaproteobacteria bacterium]|nr:MAG: hypothetical protein E6J78_01480 [Deltaproteobacteria bacterium]